MRSAKSEDIPYSEYIELKFEVPECQRAKNNQQIDLIYESFLEELYKYKAIFMANPIIIGVLKNTYLIIDGQHRHAAINKLHEDVDDDITFDIPVRYHYVSTWDEIHQLYEKINKNTLVPLMSKDNMTNIISVAVVTQLDDKYKGLMVAPDNNNGKLIRRPKINQVIFTNSLQIIIKELNLASESSIIAEFDKLYAKYSTYENLPAKFGLNKNTVEKYVAMKFILPLFRTTTHDDIEMYTWVNDILKMNSEAGAECKAEPETTKFSICDKKYRTTAAGKEEMQQWWMTYYGNVMQGKCICCGINEVSFVCRTYEISHVVSKANGGTNELSNLRPLCRVCNNSMRTMNADEYISKYYAHNYHKVFIDALL